MPEEEAKKEESRSEEKNESDSASFDKEKEQAQVWTGKITAFVGDQLRSAAPSLPIIGGGITGGLTWLHQHDTVKTVIAGGVGFIVTGIFTYGSAWSKAFLEVARTKGKDHGKGSALNFFIWLDKLDQSVKGQLAGTEDKYLRCQGNEVDFSRTEGLNTFKPLLKDVFVPLELSGTAWRSPDGHDLPMPSGFHTQKSIQKFLQKADQLRIWDILKRSPQ